MYNIFTLQLLIFSLLAAARCASACAVWFNSSYVSSDIVDTDPRKKLKEKEIRVSELPLTVVCRRVCYTFYVYFAIYYCSDIPIVHYVTHIAH